MQDVETAKQNLLECLTELAEIREYFTQNADEKVDITSQIVVTKLSSDEACCKRQNIPHLHALLNGVPVVLKLNKEALKCIAECSEIDDSNLPDDNVISVSVFSKRPDDDIIVTVEEYEEDNTVPVNDATITISKPDTPAQIKSKTGVEYVEKDVGPYSKTIVVTLPNPDQKEQGVGDEFTPERSNLKTIKGNSQECKCDWRAFYPL